jgi:hypothetical protein
MLKNKNRKNEETLLEIKVEDFKYPNKENL